MAADLYPRMFGLSWVLLYDVERHIQVEAVGDEGKSNTCCFLHLVHGQHCRIKRFSVRFPSTSLESSDTRLMIHSHMVSVPFHQILRSTTPIFTVLIYRLCFKRKYSAETYQSLIPIVAGVGLTTYGDYYFTTMGFSLTLLGTVLAALKTVVTNRLLTGSLALPAPELLVRMAPFAALQAFSYSFMTGELSQFLIFAAEGHMTLSLCLALLGNGVLACCLNVSSFQTNKLAGALTMTVCANLKQCLTVLLGIVLFDVKVGKVNGAGMMIALAGAAWYSRTELGSKS